MKTRKGYLNRKRAENTYFICGAENACINGVKDEEYEKQLSNDDDNNNNNNNNNNNDYLAIESSLGAYKFSTYMKT